jgi:hypothetical protein
MIKGYIQNNGQEHPALKWRHTLNLYLIVASEILYCRPAEVIPTKGNSNFVVDQIVRSIPIIVLNTYINRLERCRKC